MLAPVTENSGIFRRAIASYWQDSTKGPRPAYAFFVPTDDDKKTAPTRISAWLATPGTVDQVHAAFPAKAHQNPVVYFKFQSNEVLALSSSKLNVFGVTFSVAYDPNTPAKHLVDLHLGLLGFERPSGCNKALWKELILSLGDKCETLPHPES